MSTRYALIAAAVIGCAPVTTERWGYSNVYHETPYEVRATQVTPDGIHYDDTGQHISGALIDRLTSEVEVCVGKSIDRSSFVVKVPGNWQLSCDKSQQLLQSQAPEEGCRAKGLAPDPKCPCRWRARIQWGSPMVIVATPSLHLMKDALTRFATGSMDPWSDPKLAPCATPSTGPLSNGDGVSVQKHVGPQRP